MSHEPSSMHQASSIKKLGSRLWLDIKKSVFIRVSVSYEKISSLMSGVYWRGSTKRRNWRGPAGPLSPQYVGLWPPSPPPSPPHPPHKTNNVILKNKQNNNKKTRKSAFIDGWPNETAQHHSHRIRLEKCVCLLTTPYRY